MKKRLVFLAGLSAACASGGLAQTRGPAPPAPPAPPVPPVSVDTARAVNACLTSAEQQRPVAEVDAATRRRAIACVFASSAAQIRAQLPVRIDEISELVEISSSGPVLTYTYRLGRSRAELPANVAQLLENGTRSNVCAQANMVQTIAIGGSYVYRWVDRDGRQIHQMGVDRCR